jgi:hypothetical protein
MIREIYLVGRRPWIGFAAAGLRNRVHSLSLWTRFPAPLPASGASLVRNPSVEVPRPDAYCRHPPLLTFCTSIAVTCTFQSVTSDGKFVNRCYMILNNQANH